MRRREFIAVLGGAATWPFAAHSQQPSIPAIGFLSSRSPDESATHVAAFQRGLGEAGYVVSQNVTLEFRWAEGLYDRLPAMAVELVNLQVAVILAAGGNLPALAAKAATSTIPIVFTGGDRPVEVGLVASLSQPGGNVTGASLFTSEVEAKKLGLLHELMPNAPLIVMLVDPNNPSTETDITNVQSSARAVGKRVTFLRAASAPEIDAAFATLAQQRSTPLIVGHSPFFNSRREQIVRLAERSAIPAIYEVREFVTAGGLMSYGTSFVDNYRLGGIYVGQILKGAKPAELPVQQPTKFELIINLKTAKALALDVPARLLAIADDVIE
jgi:putative ABC transport system substrate-binding protein